MKIQKCSLNISVLTGTGWMINQYLIMMEFFSLMKARREVIKWHLSKINKLKIKHSRQFVLETGKIRASSDNNNQVHYERKYIKHQNILQFVLIWRFFFMGKDGKSC